MASAHATILVNEPIDKVFDFILNGENNKLWRPSVTEIKAMSKPIGVGTVFYQRMLGPNGIKIEADYEITECESNERIVFKVLNGPYRAVGTFDFTAIENATKVTFCFSENTSQVAETVKKVHLQRVVDTLINVKEYLSLNKLSR